MKNKEELKLVLFCARAKVEEDILEYHKDFPDRPKLVNHKLPPHHILPLDMIEAAGGMKNIPKSRLAAIEAVEAELKSEN